MMGHSEPERAATHQSRGPLRLFHRALGQGLTAALTMQYVLGRSALELTRTATRHHLAWVDTTTDTDQRAARHAVETGFDTIETGIADSERTATESVVATSELAADLADTYAASMESTFDTFLETAAPLGHPPTHQP